MNKSLRLGTSLAVATLLTAIANNADAAIIYRCKVKSVSATYMQQTYVQCEDQPNSFTLKSAAPLGWASDAALARFVSIALAAQLSGRSLVLYAPDNWTPCMDGNCDITGFSLVND